MPPFLLETTLAINGERAPAHTPIVYNTSLRVEELIGRYPTLPIPHEDDQEFGRLAWRYDDPIPMNWREISDRLSHQPLPANLTRVSDTIFRSNLPLPHQIAALREQGITDIICLIQNPREQMDDTAPVTYAAALNELSQSGIRVHWFPIFSRGLLEDPQVIDDIVYVYQKIKEQNGKVLIHCLKGATRTGMVSEFLLAHDYLTQHDSLDWAYRLKAMQRYVCLGRSPSEMLQIWLRNRFNRSSLIDGVPAYMQRPRDTTVNFRVLSHIMPRLEKIIKINTPSKETVAIEDRLGRGRTATV